MLSLWLLRRRALLGAIAGIVAVVVFAAFATAGLPINTRYAFLASAILCIFCGAGVFGWTRLPREDPRRRWWMAGGALVLVALLAYIPTQYHTAHRELTKLARQETFQNELRGARRKTARSRAAASPWGCRTMRRSRCSRCTWRRARGRS